MACTREITVEGYRLRLDAREQVLRLDVPEKTRYAYGAEVWTGEPLSPTLSATEDEFVPAGALVLKAKQFDDGLSAAVERAAQQGHGTLAGKASLLRSLAERLAGSTGPGANGALAVLFGACRLGGLGVEPPPQVRPSVEATVAEFLAADLRSKPLGFYTWTAELAALFRQDRLLQAELDPAEA
jgi:hypothetical protein